MWLLCYKLDLLSYSFLFHTCWDLHYEVISFVSLIGRTMYFHSRSPKILKISRPERKHLSTYKKKQHTMESAWTIVNHLLWCIKKLTRSLRTFVRSFDASQLVNKNVRGHFPWNNLYISNFRKAMSKYRKDQNVCSQGLNLLRQLTRHLSNGEICDTSLQDSRGISKHILNAFW